MAKFAILVDECVDPCVLDALRDWGYDAERTPHAGRSNSPKDSEVIAIAARSGRVIVTNDVSTMLPRFLEYIEDGNDHPGLFVAAQRWSIGEYLRNLRYTLQATRPEDIRNTWSWLLRGVPAGGAE